MLALMALGVALAVALGRVIEQPNHAHGPSYERYNTIVAVYWAGVFGLLLGLCCRYGQGVCAATMSVILIWLGLLLSWFMLTLWRWPNHVAIGLFVTAIGFLVTLNLLNPDAFIVRQNLARYRATGDLDAAYLVSLSADAVPGVELAHKSSGFDCGSDDLAMPTQVASSSAGGGTFNQHSGQLIEGVLLSVLED